MRSLQITIATAFAVTAISPSVAAATLSPTQQVRQAAEWFTGFFDNRAQVSRNSSIPFITMENCAVGLSNGMADSRYVHLEQYIGEPTTLLRSSAYEFGATATGVSLSVFSYQDRPSALGSCDQTTPTLELANLALPSCDVSLTYKPEQFVGTNAPEGCPSSFPVPGSTVVSSITLSADQINALDNFLLPTGGSFGTPIEFRRVSVSTPEPVSTVAFMLVGITGVLAHRERT
ncbi:MAG: CpcT/CpeT family chromophore lyase [Phormidesmis sp.]